MQVNKIPPKQEALGFFFWVWWGGNNKNRAATQVRREVTDSHTYRYTDTTNHSTPSKPNKAEIFFTDQGGKNILKKEAKWPL